MQRPELADGNPSVVLLRVEIIEARRLFAHLTVFHKDRTKAEGIDDFYPVDDLRQGVPFRDVIDMEVPVLVHQEDVPVLSLEFVPVEGTLTKEISVVLAGDIVPVESQHGVFGCGNFFRGLITVPSFESYARRCTQLGSMTDMYIRDPGNDVPGFAFAVVGRVGGDIFLRDLHADGGIGIGVLIQIAGIHLNAAGGEIDRQRDGDQPHFLFFFLLSQDGGDREGEQEGDSQESHRQEQGNFTGDG